jgi:Txe/YoeB family toxin of Txe-Axe toxin-antitoxin module
MRASNMKYILQGLVQRNVGDSHNLSGYWSRRITDEHRLVYQLRDDEFDVVRARYHY